MRQRKRVTEKLSVAPVAPEPSNSTRAPNRSELNPIHPIVAAACAHSTAPTEFSPTVPDDPTNKTSHNEYTRRVNQIRRFHSSCGYIRIWDLSSVSTRPCLIIVTTVTMSFRRSPWPSSTVAGVHAFVMFIAPILSSFVTHHFRVRAGHPLPRKTGAATRGV